MKFDVHNKYCTTQNFGRQIARQALCAVRRLLKRDTIASRDRLRPMGARQNLALYYNSFYKTKEMVFLFTSEVIIRRDRN